jgi:RNA polymerase sigma-70 factor, ECF subfamily
MEVSMNDDDLVRQLREGDDRAAAFLVSLHAPRLFGYARAIAPDLSDTDRQFVCDIAVETAVRRIDRFDGERGTLERWLRPFVRHAVQDWRGTNEHLSELPAEPLSSTTSESTDPARELARQRVAEAISELSVTDQLIIGLRDQEQLTYLEIATRLGVSEAACRQRHLRAVRRLAQAIDEDKHVMPILREHGR